MRSEPESLSFLSNLPLIDHEIREGGEFELSADDPPVAYIMDGADRTFLSSWTEPRTRTSLAKHRTRLSSSSMAVGPVVAGAPP
jgi:hypothetical protein